MTAPPRRRRPGARDFVRPLWQVLMKLCSVLLMSVTGWLVFRAALQTPFSIADWLALAAISGLSFATDVQAANKLYDMNQMMDQGNPLDVRQVPQTVPQPAKAPHPGSAQDSRFGSQLYDMDRMLNERNPFDSSSPSQPPIRSERPVETAQAVNPPPSPAPVNIAKPPAKPASTRCSGPGRIRSSSGAQT